MQQIRTTKDILKEWCDKNLSTHTDWTGTRVEHSKIKIILTYMD